MLKVHSEQNLELTKETSPCASCAFSSKTPTENDTIDCDSKILELNLDFPKPLN